MVHARPTFRRSLDRLIHPASPLAFGLPSLPRSSAEGREHITRRVALAPAPTDSLLLATALRLLRHSGRGGLRGFRLLGFSLLRRGRRLLLRSHIHPLVFG